ncbi:hypothetical protein [Dictyobacter kobayashii]|uniref:Uncharacterized protein n=1 Tax=Dictyobacter kobayashii TaxID=2014872 RepID=A0A402AJ24_9CHLR|nr:hypothetical protein [Dictyobacter kobayashii]GCE19054.1 hypothetical protein KDK_28540 [Dictyobacter kobayashii]
MDQDKLYTLALRLAIHPGAPNVQDPQLLVERLPDTLPVPLPLPEEYTILGSLVSSPGSMQIFLDIPNTNGEIQDFYQRELPAAGWILPEEDIHMRRGGFIQSRHDLNYLSYTYSNHEWTLTIQTTTTTSRNTDVRLQLYKDELARRQRRRIRRHGPDMFTLFPALTSPQGASQIGGNSGSSGNDVYTTATLKLQEESNIVDVSKHYTDQLLLAGWNPLKDEQSPHSAWSSWHFSDKEGDEWNATFYLFELAEKPHHYQLSLQANLKDINV